MARGGDGAQVAEHGGADVHLVGERGVECVHEEDEDGTVVRRCARDVGVDVGGELEMRDGWRRRLGLMLFKEGDLLGDAVFEGLKMVFAEST